MPVPPRPFEVTGFSTVYAPLADGKVVCIIPAPVGRLQVVVLDDMYADEYTPVAEFDLWSEALQRVTDMVKGAGL